MHTYMRVSFYCTVLGCLSKNSIPSGSVFLSDMAISMKVFGRAICVHAYRAARRNYANKSEINVKSDPSSIVTVIGQSRCISGIQWEMIVLWVGESETESSVFVGRVYCCFSV